MHASIENLYSVTQVVCNRKRSSPGFYVYLLDHFYPAVMRRVKNHIQISHPWFSHKQACRTQYFHPMVTFIFAFTFNSESSFPLLFVKAADLTARQKMKTNFRGEGFSALPP